MSEPTGQQAAVIHQLTELAERVGAQGHPGADDMKAAVGIAEAAKAAFPDNLPPLQDLQQIVDGWMLHIGTNDAELIMSDEIALYGLLWPLLTTLCAAANAERPTITPAIASLLDKEELGELLRGSATPAEAEVIAAEMDLRELHQMPVPERPN